MTIPITVSVNGEPMMWATLSVDADRWINADDEGKREYVIEYLAQLAVTVPEGATIAW